MFGTVARVTVQPGKDEELIAIGEEWVSARGEATGEVASYLFKLEERPGDYVLIGIFRDRAQYYANAHDPETDRWYRRMRATLAADPEWHDGEVIQSAILSGI
ncbi:MAG TPA: antibiotic biosynthesis monooxygenase [Thermomicrobiales bacterium]|nr:antibiotic biosynthesis monooxygenase [Thermomicrobiales bacterium]